MFVLPLKSFFEILLLCCMEKKLLTEKKVGMGNVSWSLSFSNIVPGSKYITPTV